MALPVRRPSRPTRRRTRRRPAGHDRPPLTARQLLVARASTAGKSNRQIAAELYISVKAVEFHLSQILASGVSV
jgi:DNA-binding NarL/FixJ family response regulator